MLNIKKHKIMKNNLRYIIRLFLGNTTYQEANKSNMNTFFNRVLQSDTLPFEANPSIQKRLEHAVELKRSNTTCQQKNCIFGSLFSFQNLGIKAGVISLFIIGVTFFNKMDQISLTSLHSEPYIADTSHLDTFAIHKLGCIDTLR